MKINKENYELFFVDYFDGNLSEESTRELIAFLEKHPDLKAEFEAFEPIILHPGKVTFPGKAGLKKSGIVAVGAIDETNYEDFVIAHHEGDLDDVGEKQLNAFLDKNPNLQDELVLYEKTILSPEKAIVFPEKQQLKKQPLLVHLRRRAYWYGVAASLALLITVFYPARDKDSHQKPIDKLVAYYNEPVNYTRQQKEPEQRQAAKPVAEMRPVAVRNSVMPVAQLASLKTHRLTEPKSRLNPHKRMEMTSLYYYDQLEQDLEYYAMLQEYNKKTLAERVAYQLKNRISGQEDIYITDPALTKLNFSAETLTALNDFTLSDILPDNKPAKPKDKNYHFKSDLIEVLRSRKQ